MAEKKGITPEEIVALYTARKSVLEPLNEMIVPTGKAKPYSPTSLSECHGVRVFQGVRTSLRRYQQRGSRGA